MGFIPGQGTKISHAALHSQKKKKTTRHMLLLQYLRTNVSTFKIKLNKSEQKGFPGGAVVRNPPSNAGDMGSSNGPEDPTCCGATKPIRHNY